MPEEYAVVGNNTGKAAHNNNGDKIMKASYRLNKMRV